MSAVSAPSIGRILLPFCAPNRGLVPGLAFPAYVAGTGGTTLTFASDGQDGAIWTKGRVGHYRDWSPMGSPEGFSPVDWRSRYRSGASTPLPAPGGRKPAEIWFLGRVGWLAPRWVAALSAFDACWLAGAAKTADGHRWAELSFIATLDKRLFNGVIVCPQPS